MPMVSDSPTLASWIKENTKGASCVVDMGAGFFDKLRYVPPMAKKIGIEVFPAYIAFAPVGVQAVCADFQEWERFVNPPYRDTAMLIDTLEHIPKQDGINLLRGLQQHFRRILVMTPDGFHPQDEDVTGYENEFQKHECGYSSGELEELGFSVNVVEDYHGPNGGAIFGVWSRE